MDKSSENVCMNLFRVFDRAGTLLYIGLLHGPRLESGQVDLAILRHLNDKPWFSKIKTTNIRTQHLVGTYIDAVTVQICCEMVELPKYGMSYRSVIRETSKPEAWPFDAEPGSLN